jgi:hypothetical protein
MVLDSREPVARLEVGVALPLFLNIIIYRPQNLRTVSLVNSVVQPVHSLPVKRYVIKRRA